MYKERYPRFVFYKYVDYKAVNVREHLFEFIFQGAYYSHTFYLKIIESNSETQYQAHFDYTRIRKTDLNQIEDLYFSASYYFEYDHTKSFYENLQEIMESDFETVQTIEPEEITKHIKLHMPTPERR